MNAQIADTSGDAPALLVAPCSYEAAKHAVLRWHYSKCMPSSKLVKFGVWEHGVYKGCVLFGRGANHHIGDPYGLTQTQVCELVRIALRTHAAPVSRIAAIAVRLLRQSSPGIRLVISYADPAYGHHGGVYQAMGWVYTGTSQAQGACLIDGRVEHKRTVSSLHGSIAGMGRTAATWKHKYALPLDSEMRGVVESLRKPYPKRTGSTKESATIFQMVCGGSTPTPVLHSIVTKRHLAMVGAL